MAYSFQTFSVAQVLTAAQMNQVEINIRDHVHGISSVSQIETAKARVLFNGSGVVAIRGSFNVSSITDNAQGDWTVNFTTAFSAATYAGVVAAGRGATGAQARLSTSAPYNTDPTVSAFRFLVGDNAFAAQDAEWVSAAFFGTQ